MGFVAATLLPLVLVVASGFAAARFRLFDLAAARLLSRFVFMIAMPAAIVSFMSEAGRPGPEYLPMMLAYLLAVVPGFFGAMWMARSLLKRTAQEAGAHGFAASCGNAVFFGFPIALAVEGWAQAFVLLMVLEGTITYSLGAIFMEKSAGNPENRWRMILMRPLRSPLVLACLVGLGFSLGEVPVPGLVAGWLSFLGASAPPVGLFVLGLYIGLVPLHHLRSSVPSVGLVGLSKLLILPVSTALIAGVLTGWNPQLTGAAALMTAMPPAVSSLLQASHYQTYEEETAAALVILSPLSLVGVALVLMIFVG